MGDVFDGWRRKTGLVTLAVACVLMTGWMRSYHQEDQFRLFRGRVASRNGAIERLERLFVKDLRPLEETDGATAGKQPRRGSVVVAVFRERCLWRLPYWSVTVPLSIISAGLILSRPRVREGSSR